MVSASGERILSSRFRASAGSARRSACSWARRRTKSSNCAFNARCVSHSSPSSTLSIALQVCAAPPCRCQPTPRCRSRSEEHTSELQSHHDLVCRLLLEKKKKKKKKPKIKEKKKQKNRKK